MSPIVAFCIVVVVALVFLATMGRLVCRFYEAERRLARNAAREHEE